MDELRALESSVQKHYDDALAPIAKRLATGLPRSPHDAPSVPMVLFLGNHSSGKSSFINYLIGAPRQKTGLAPTDDGFTVLTYGEREDELDGQSAVTHPSLALHRLEKLGPTFLARMRLKTHPADILQSMSLVDSPGMIDAAGTASGRGYDFSAGVRAYAEMADLILFFFDPDKPGTTGETISIFTETLSGLEHKLLIVLNKVDLFANIRDFARTYGTLCWNLSKTMQTKDVPHIFNMYLPGQFNRGGDSENGDGVPLSDFAVSREEVENEIRRAPSRRADNLVSDLLQQGRMLHMQGQVIEAVAERHRKVGLNTVAIASVLVAAGVTGAFLLRQYEDWRVPGAVGAGSLLLAAVTVFVGRALQSRLRQRFSSPAGLDGLYEDLYRQELAWEQRADLHALWERVRPRVLNTLDLLGFGQLPHGFGFRRQLRKLASLLESDIPRLRRQLPQRQEAPETEPAAQKKR